jgi:hypothetical protein
MPSDRARSAALVISLHRDATGGSPWHARLASYSDATRDPLEVTRCVDEQELLAAVRAWLARALAPGELEDDEEDAPPSPTTPA